MKGRQGFTLMELLVVLLIIGILSTVALRTIDATRNRSLFDQTTAEMNKLVQAIVGNPDLAYDGRRVDFGYYGDMEQLPPTLRDLLYNTSGSAAWRGPYVKLMTAGDTVSYLYDEWGHVYTYRPGPADITSLGVNGLDMTLRIVDDTAQLNHNMISGSFLDRDDNPPGVPNPAYEVRLHYNNRDAHIDSVATVNPTPGGSYVISLTPEGGNNAVPIGIKRLQAIIPGETLTRYVTVAPRSHVVADFRFTKSFGRLRMVGQPALNGDSSGFTVYIVNDAPVDDTISWLSFFQAPAAAFMRDFHIGSEKAGFPTPNGSPGTGPGDTVNFSAPVAIAPDGSQMVELYFYDFYVDEVIPPPSTHANVHGKTFEFRFSDGSKITVNP